MELEAVIGALEMLRNNEEAILYSDSKYVISGINEWITKWVNNYWKTNEGWVKNKDLWEKLLNLKNNSNIKFIWQRGHSSREIELVDYLAKSETQKAKNSY